MTINARNATLAALLLVLAGCATSRPASPVKPRALLGTDSDVRLDAEISVDTLTVSQQIAVHYVVSNNRPSAIAIAELLPESSYDDDTRVVTVSLGTEVPGQELLPRLVVIGPGQKKTFSAAARVTIPIAGTVSNPYLSLPTGIQLKLNFLTDPKPFAALIGIPERAVHDPRLAEELFPKWLERNESLFTNILPMRWSNGDPTDGPQSKRDASHP